MGNTIYGSHKVLGTRSQSTHTNEVTFRSRRTNYWSWWWLMLLYGCLHRHFCLVMIAPTILYGRDCTDTFIWSIMVWNLSKYVACDHRKSFLKMNRYFILHLFILTVCALHLEFRIMENTIIVDQKSKLENLLHHNSNQRVFKVVYRSPILDVKGSIRFSKFELKKKDDVRLV